MCLALGKNKQDECEKGLFEVTKKLKGQTGLLFTNDSPQNVLKYVLVHFILLK